MTARSWVQVITDFVSWWPRASGSASRRPSTRGSPDGGPWAVLLPVAVAGRYLRGEGVDHVRQVARRTAEPRDVEQRYLAPVTRDTSRDTNWRLLDVAEAAEGDDSATPVV